MTDEEKVKIALLKTGESVYESLLERGMSPRLRQQGWGPEEPLPSQERDAPWWVVALVWAVVALAGLAALRRLLS